MKDKDLSGALFKNERKLKPNSPDFSGQFISDSFTYNIVGWTTPKHKGTENGSGLLFYNERKTEDHQPDMVGWIITPTGIRHILYGYNRNSKNGNDYFKLILKIYDPNNLPSGVNPIGLLCKIRE